MEKFQAHTKVMDQRLNTVLEAGQSYVSHLKSMRRHFEVYFKL